tara:strand:+ start:185 stop:1228 length:1044 start_codon:yes stop_codon:yes gene_type:complete
MKTTNFLNFLIVSIALILIAACQKTDFSGQASASDVYSGSLGAFFADEIASMTESATMDATNGGTATLSDGTEVNIPAGSFVDANGNSVSGDIDISITTISGNVDMAVTNIPSTSNGEMIISGGVVNVSANQGGTNLELSNPITVTIPNSFENNTTPGDQGAINMTANDMEFYQGVEQPDGSINWELNTSVTPVLDANTNTFSFDVSGVGFMNMDKLANDPQNCLPDLDGDLTNGFESPCRVDFSLKCPNGFSPGSMQVWIYYNNLSSLLGVPYNTQNDAFEINGILGGQTVHTVILAEKDGSFYTLDPAYWETGLLTPGPVIPNIPATLMIPVTTDEWKAMLNALP